MPDGYFGGESCPENGLDECLFCTGEACDLCGAGCWSNVDDCEHDVVERHGHTWGGLDNSDEKTM